jgi:hypothetical protein
MTTMSFMKVVLALPLLLGGAVASDKRRINPAGHVDTVVDEYAKEDEVFWGRNLELMLESLSKTSTAHPTEPPTQVGNRRRRLPEQYGTRNLLVADSKNCMLLMTCRFT